MKPSSNEQLAYKKSSSLNVIVSVHKNQSKFEISALRLVVQNLIDFHAAC